MPSGLILVSDLSPLLVELPDLLVKSFDLLVKSNFPFYTFSFQRLVVGLGVLVRLSGLLKGDDLQRRDP